MTVAQLIHAAFPVSIALIVLGLGLRCTMRDAAFLFREPGLLLRSVLAMNVVQLLVALLIVATTSLHPAVAIALVALALSPVPPILPNKQLKLVTRESYVYGLLVATSVLSIVLIPVTMSLLGAMTGRALHLEAATVARIVVTSVLAPLVLGMILRRLFPAFAGKATAIANLAGTLILVAALLIALVAGWPAMRGLIGDGTLLACMVFAAAGLAVGHILGGPDPDDRTVLALATASRHPGVAIAIGAATFPEQKLEALAVVLYLLVSTIASVPYTAWRKRIHEKLVPRPR